AGSAGADGGAGNTIVLGNQGSDLVTGGDGNDILLGDLGPTSTTLGAGDDTVVGGAGDDVVQGGPGADQVSGGDGTDVLFEQDIHVLHLGDGVLEADGVTVAGHGFEAANVTGTAGADVLDASGFTLGPVTLA